MENCTEYGTAEMLPDLNNVEVIFLSPNNTSEIPPIDAGARAFVKIRYLCSQVERAVDMDDEEVRKIYKIYILSVMPALKTVWVELPADIIRRCWNHTKILPSILDRPSLSSAQVSVDSDRSNLGGLTGNIFPARACMSIDGLLSAPRENECTQGIDDEQLLIQSANEECDFKQDTR